MKAIARSTFILLVLCLPALTQDAKKPDDILQKKDGGLIVGRVIKMDGETADFLAKDEKEPRNLADWTLKDATEARGLLGSVRGKS